MFFGYLDHPQGPGTITSTQQLHFIHLNLITMMLTLSA